jgi:hypothetical protein
MATLTSGEIRKILMERPGAAIVQAAEAMHKKLSVHINGIGLADYLDQINTYEKPEALALRKRYARSNIDLFDRLSRPIDKVFAARGGSRYFPSTDEQIARKMDVALMNVENGYSSKKWIETFWKPRYMDDPMGLVFMEVYQNETYPTYKACTDIYDYKLNGRKLDWVVFRTEDKSIFRVVDDKFDALYKKEGDSITKLRNEVYPNYFGYVPGIVISDLPKAGMKDIYVSPFNSVVELADEYLRDESIRMIYKFKHGFPKSWKYREMCGTCKGTGAIAAGNCGHCNGTGKKLDSTVSEVMVLDWPTQNDQVIAPDVAGFITPDLEYLKYSRDELVHLETMMYRTHWGTYPSEQRTTGEADTAAAKFMDVQPINDKLTAYADAAETTEKFIIDAIGDFNYGQSYEGVRISYGRRFMIEGPDVVWRKYEQARKMGAPMGTLNEHLTEYYEAKFQANPIELAKHLKMMRVEPFVHLTVDEAFKVVGPDEFSRKLYFAEWCTTIKDAQWLVMTDEALKDSLTKFAEARYEEPEPEGSNDYSDEGNGVDPNNLMGKGGKDNAAKGTKSKKKNPDGTLAGANTDAIDND